MSAEKRGLKLALSMLCENPHRKTGLTTLFHEFVSNSVRLFPDVRWLLFLGPEQEWTIEHPLVELDRSFPANDRLNKRLLADHFHVPQRAREKEADALLTVGFVPARKTLPVAMHVFSLQHLDRSNRVGFARELYRRWVTRFSWPKADLVITNSKFAASQIFSIYPEFRDRLVQSYEGLQHGQFRPNPLPREAAELQTVFNVRPGYFLWISNFYPYKQPDLLIDAYSRMSWEFQAAHPLLMIGGDWENVLAGLKDRIRKLGIEAHVRFPGWVDDRLLAPLYRHAQAFCLPSREETFGRCVIEAMACGTPVIANDIPIMREVAGDSADLVDFTNTGAVSESLKRAANDLTWQTLVRRRGLERASHFTFERLTSERITAIRGMLDRSRARV